MPKIIDLRIDTQRALEQELIESLQKPVKSIPPYWNYDEAGIELFIKISKLPSYYLSRAELAILEEQAPILAQWIPYKNLQVIELGAGDAHKAALLLEALIREEKAVEYFPIDFSRQALQIAYSTTANMIAGLQVTPVCGDYLAGLAHISRLEELPKLVLFLGPSIGNLTPTQAHFFLERLAALLMPEDLLLIGFDLLKDERLLQAAHQDPIGLSAAFSKNALCRLNKEFKANFNPELFRHHVIFDPSQQAIKSYLIAQEEHMVSVPTLELGFRLQAYEPIQTEYAQKFTSERIQNYLNSAKLKLRDLYTDAQSYFALALVGI